MDFSSAFPTFVITLREGVEAALVVGIVFAYLKKAEKTDLNPWVYGGIGMGLLASILVGGLSIGLIETLGSANREYEPVVKPLLNAVFSVVAIAMLSWMLIWMTRQARLLKSEVESAIGTTLKAETGAGWGIFGLIFFAVLREGFETVLFLSARFDQGWLPLLGAGVGIVAAVGVGVLLFRWGIRINLRLFFQVMGIFLLLIVAGLVVSALAHFDAAIATLAQLNPQYENLCLSWQAEVQTSSCLLGSLIWDTSSVLPEKQFPGILLHTLFGYEDRLYVLQAFGYVGFLLTVGGAYLQTLTGGSAISPSSRTPANPSSQ
ncbi:MAG: FTR1 family protein [Kovacikia sp.]